MLPNSHPAYRPDVDGLRAIAVLAVIAFHANPKILPGGFAGVDVFFVVSGFLITGLIYKGLEQGSFRFLDFYTRRIKRILPAYIVVALATLVISTFLLIPNDYIFYTTSLAASWGFAANVFFSMLSWGYFGQRTEEFPLLHTWSLSVEEQFYFIFPILLLFLFRHARKQIVLILITLCILFSVLSEMKTGEVKSYFLLTSRAHELLIGSLTFFMLKKYPVRSRPLAHLMTVAGGAMMVGSFFLLSRGTSFPGFNSLYPCLGAALVIHAGGTGNLASPFLKSRIMVFIGLLSYSLYLWHWPIFSFLRYRRIEITFWVACGAIALAFLLAYLTWKFIESPIRNNRNINFRNAFVKYYAVPCTFFLSVGLYSYLTEGAPRRFPDDIRQLISSYSFERDLSRSCSIRPSDYKKITPDYLDRNCAFGNPQAAKASVLLMGDSHAHHFKPFVEQLANSAGRKSVFHVQGSCLPTELQAAGGADADTCQKRNRDLLDIAGQFDFVVLAAYWSSEADQHFERQLASVVGDIVRAGATPVIFKDNPAHEPDLSQCILFKRRGWYPEDRNCNIPYQGVVATEAEVDRVIDQVAKTYPKAIVVDPKQVMCNASECVTYIGNTALYKDANHINAKASALLGKVYVSSHGNPFSGAVPDKLARTAAAGVK